MGTPQQPYNNSIFWVDVDKIRPNPYQPRTEFDEARLRDLADSIRQYGVLQPLVVTRHEEQSDEGITAYYELIAGERRLRASKLAGIGQLPVIIREGSTSEEGERVKLEIAIIENVQREDLNPVERARAFKRLADDFGYKHAFIAQKIGKSREYVANSIRLLALPEEVLNALAEGKITEGHTRPLLMLGDKKEEQATLLKDILYKQLTVREAERAARTIAHEKARKRDIDPTIRALEEQLTSQLGTRVYIEQREKGGRLTINFASIEEIQNLFDRVEGEADDVATSDTAVEAEPEENSQPEQPEAPARENAADTPTAPDEHAASPEQPANENPKQDDTDLYSVTNFSI